MHAACRAQCGALLSSHMDRRQCEKRCTCHAQHNKAFLSEQPHMSMGHAVREAMHVTAGILQQMLIA
eukprot:1158767-Pelagomonas_calceolata.AAC.2